MLSLRGKDSPSRWARTKTQNSRKGARGCGALTYTVRLLTVSLRGFSGSMKSLKIYTKPICVFTFSWEEGPEI